MDRARVALVALVLQCAVWGLTFPLVQDAVADLPVMSFLGYRFVAAAILAAVIFWTPLRSMSRAGVRAGALMGVFLTGGYIFQTFGLERTTSSNAGFITGLFVVLTPLFGGLFMGYSTKRQAWVAAGISALGLYLLSGTGKELHIAGDLLVLACAVSFTFHILVTDPAVREHDVRALLVVQLAFCGAFCLGVAALGRDLVLPEEGATWTALVITAVFASVVGFYVQAYAQTHASPARTALVLASEPAFAGLFAYLLKDERLSALGWLGAALIMTAIVTVEVLPNLRLRRPLPER
ncbi:MAG TPA: DMT family transporter [Actinomycetota bacterium]|nr:DMT family transporter [Actinomycetota bacterium]